MGLPRSGLNQLFQYHLQVPVPDLMQHAPDNGTKLSGKRQQHFLNLENSKKPAATDDLS